MKSYYSDILRMISDYVPYEVRRKSSTDWVLPTFLGVGLGVAAGVGIGLLMAPAPGYETRRQLKDGAYRMKDKAIEAANKAKDKMNELTVQAKNGTSSFLNEAGSVR